MQRRGEIGGGSFMNEQTWLEQKLAQNGFTLEDLSKQTGIDRSTLLKMAEKEEARDEQWNTVLSVLNSYPILYTPSADLLDLLRQRIEQSSAQEMCTVYYGVNQSNLIFALCQFEDGSIHGANVQPDFLRSLHLPLGEVLQLFQAQELALENGKLS